MMNIDQTDVVILCGGLGTRLRSVTGENPKVLVSVNGRPFLDLLLDEVRRQGGRRVILCVGYQAGKIQEYYTGRDTGLNLVCSREDQPLGTGGAICRAAGLIESDSFLVLNGDSFCPVDMRALGAFHQDKRALGTIAVCPGRAGGDYGGVVLEEGTDRVLAFQEKDRSSTASYVNAGVYVLSRAVFKQMPDQERFSLEYDVFPRCVDQGALWGFRTEAPLWDIGTPERLARIRRDVDRLDHYRGGSRRD